MTQPIISTTEDQEKDIKTNGARSFTGRSKPLSPLDQIRAWYEDQADNRIRVDFVGLITFFYPHDELQNELNPERRTAMFHEYLTLAPELRHENVKRAITLIGHIDFITVQQEAEERRMKIPDIINYRWMEWLNAWKSLRRSSLTSKKILRWYFPEKRTA